MNNNDKKTLFYQKVRRLCVDAGVSPSKMVQKIGMAKGTMSAWKRGGGVTNPVAMKVAAFFGVTVDSLINDDVLVNRIISDAPPPSSSTGVEPMANCGALISAKDETIAALKRESAQLHARLAEANATKEEAIASLKRENDTLRERLADKDAERGRLITEKDKRIAELERRAVVAERRVEELKLENSQSKNERKSAGGASVSDNSKTSKSARVVV